MLVPPITLTVDDGTVIVAQPKPIDIMFIEREYGTDARDRQVESTLHMAWSALQREGENRPFEEWAVTIADVQFGEDVVDPTNAAQSTDSPPN